MHPEGYIKGTEWHYYLKDHLGNTRVDFVANGTSTSNVQDYHYYPFGMDFTGLNVGNSDNKYKYNGKELQGDHGLDWYDFEARFYDAQIGRWHVVDPLAEEIFGITPYNYCFNNPIKFIDPTGMMGEAYASTFVDVTGKVIEHRDDDDPNVYMVFNQEDWEKGGKKKDNLPIVGWEDWRKSYKEGDQYTYYNPTEDPDYDGQYMIPASAYNYSQDAIDGKAGEDWAYYLYGGPWYKMGLRWHKLMLREASSESNRGTVVEAGVESVLVGVGGKPTGWITRRIFKSLPPAIQAKFINAMRKGIVAPKGQTGIIKLSASEIAQKGLVGYTHKLKILGKGADPRIYGRMGDNNHIVFDKILGH